MGRFEETSEFGPWRPALFLRVGMVCSEFDPQSGNSGDAADARLPAPKKIPMKPHVNWGHASAHPLGRVFVESDWGSMDFAQYVDEVSEHC